MGNYPEPSWGTSQEGVEPTSYFYKKDINAFELTGVIVRLLQYHFADPDNIDNDLLKGYIWDEDDTVSKLIIGPEYLRNDKTNLKKPSIFIKRKDVQATALGELRRHVVKSNGTQLNQPNYWRHLTGKFILSCEGSTGGEAEAIGQEVFDRIMFFSPTIEQDFRLDSFNVSGQGEVQYRKEHSLFIAPVVLTWQKIPSWSILSQEPY